MRVYLPTTLPGLDELHRRGRYRLPRGLVAHAVTDDLRAQAPDQDEEGLELLATLDASQTSLRAIAADPAAPARRVVVAADVPDAQVHAVGPEQVPWGGFSAVSAVALNGDVALDRVRSVHVDEAGAQDEVTAGAAALAAADSGDESAQDAVQAAVECDLLWYHVSEIGDLVG